MISQGLLIQERFWPGIRICMLNKFGANSILVFDLGMASGMGIILHMLIYDLLGAIPSCHSFISAVPCAQHCTVCLHSKADTAKDNIGAFRDIQSIEDHCC